MPKKPNLQRMVVCRARVKYLGPGEYHIMCRDQSGQRCPTADRIESDYEIAATVARNLVNKSFPVPEEKP